MVLFVRILQTAISIYEFLIIVWCIISWIPAKQGGWLADISAVIDSIVGPYMNLFRKFIPPLGGIDFSPVVGILVLSFIQGILHF